jgi:hypothetical protein
MPELLVDAATRIVVPVTALPGSEAGEPCEDTFALEALGNPSRCRVVTRVSCASVLLAVGFGLFRVPFRFERPGFAVVAQVRVAVPAAAVACPRSVCPIAHVVAGGGATQ